MPSAEARENTWLLRLVLVIQSSQHQLIRAWSVSIWPFLRKGKQVHIRPDRGCVDAYVGYNLKRKIQIGLPYMFDSYHSYHNCPLFCDTSSYDIAYQYWMKDSKLLPIGKTWHWQEPIEDPLPTTEKDMWPSTWLTGGGRTHCASSLAWFPFPKCSRGTAMNTGIG